MSAYPPEHLLAQELQRHDALVREFAAGTISFSTFRNSYGSFYWELALDGHESDEAGRAVLAKYEHRIAPHRVISEQVLARLSNSECQPHAQEAAIAALMVQAAIIAGGEI